VLQKCVSGLRSAFLSVVRPTCNLPINSTVSNTNFIKFDSWNFCWCLLTYCSIGYNRKTLKDVKTFARFCLRLVLFYLCRNEKYFDKNGKKINLTFMGPCIANTFHYMLNKMQRYTVYLYLETALHVSGGTSTHRQECKQLYLQHLVFVTPLLLPAAITANTCRGFQEE
jgi:hypothetical protein